MSVRTPMIPDAEVVGEAAESGAPGDPAPSFEAEGVAWTRAQAEGWTSTWIGAVAMIPIAVGLAFNVDPAFFGGVLLSFVPSFARRRMRKAWERARTRPASLRVDAQGLELGEMRIPRDAIVGADLVAGQQAGWVVRIDVNGEQPVLVELERHEQAEALLSALGYPVHRRLSRFRLTHPKGRTWRSWVPVSLLAIAVALGVAFGFVPAVKPVLLAAATAWVLATSRPSRVAIGDDGVEVRGRFVPYSQIRSLRLEGTTFVIDLVSGESLGLGSVGVKEQGKLEEHPLWLRLQEMLRRQSHEGPSAESELLSRGERTNDAWVQAMVALARGQAGYRDRIVTPERLREIVADGAQPPPVRMGAAIAVAAAGGHDDLQILRAVAASTALPSLRAAFEALLAGGPAAIAEPVRVAVEAEETAVEVRVASALEGRSGR